MFKLIFFAPLVDFGGFDSRQAYLFICSRSSGALRCAVYGQKKAVAPKTGKTAAGTTKTATKDRKVYRRILMRSAPVSGKK